MIDLSEEITNVVKMVDLMVKESLPVRESPPVVEVEEEEQDEVEQEEIEEEEDESPKTPEVQKEQEEEEVEEEEPQTPIVPTKEASAEDAEEEEEESVEEVLINGKRYYASNTTNGIIYDIDEEDNPGDEVGKYVNGVPSFTNVVVAAPVSAQEEEEEEESVEEWEFEDDKYYVSNTKNGKIYLMTKDEEVGDEIGKFVNGKPIFYD